MSEKHKDVSMETLEERVNKVINKLHDVKAMGVTISVDQRPEFRHLVSQTSEHIETVKDCLLDSVTNQLSPKQLSFLIRDTSSSACADDRDEDNFVLEWEGVFGRCYNLVSNIRIYRQKRSLGLVDSLTLAILLADCTRVQAEVELYGRLVIAQRVRPPPSQQEQTVRAVKYRKNKTENLSRLTSSDKTQSPRRSFILKHLSVSALKLKL